MGARKESGRLQMLVTVQHALLALKVRLLLAHHLLGHAILLLECWLPEHAHLVGVHETLLLACHTASSSYCGGPSDHFIGRSIELLIHGMETIALHQIS